MRKLAHFIPLAALAIALFGAGSRPAAAQMVPRLVDYPVTAACVTDTHTGLAQERIANRIAVFSVAGCPANALLYTVSTAHGRTTVTPTALGVAFLAESCAQYPWTAGSAQDVSASGCGDLVARP